VNREARSVRFAFTMPDPKEPGQLTCRKA
jgi:hypothetical protein